AQAAGITYRQLDYWARSGWITPRSLEKAGAGRVVRRYGVADVVRLQAFAHLGRAGVDLRQVAPEVSRVQLAAGRLLVFGPLDLRGADPALQLIAEADVQAVVSRPGRWVVYDPGALFARLSQSAPDTHEGDQREALTADHEEEARTA